MDILRPFYGRYYLYQGAQYELNTSIDLARWLVEGDYGWSNVQWTGQNEETEAGTKSTYTSKGQYFRIGFNYNLLSRTSDNNQAFLGFRYARSFFGDHLVSRATYYLDARGRTRLINERGRDIPHIDSRQEKIVAYWLEVVCGIKVRVWRLLYAGCTLRRKFGLRYNSKRTDSHIPYDIPGWGLNDRKKNPIDFNFYLAIRIPLTYSPPIYAGKKVK